MASTSFRDSINSLGWSRRDADLSVNTAQQSGLITSLKSLNPFGDRGYVQLPTTEGPGAALPAPSRREEEEGWFARESPSPPCSASFSDLSVGSVSSSPWCCSLPLQRADTVSHVPPTPCACLDHLHMGFKFYDCLTFSPHIDSHITAK